MHADIAPPTAQLMARLNLFLSLTSIFSLQSIMVEYEAFVVVKCMSKSLVKSAELYAVKCEHFLVFFSVGHLNFNLCNISLLHMQLSSSLYYYETS